MPKWTTDQALAIDSRGGKIIVSAAAGSGKTAVLSQRVIKYVLDGGNVNDLLIVTFTKAAAMEMKGRIKEKIEKAFLEDKGNLHLKNQMSLIEIADITTMDAFYGNIVKDNFEKIGIKRNFNILSLEEEKILKDKVLGEILEGSFERVEGYEKLLDMFGANSTNLIKEEVLKVSDFLDTLPFEYKFISKAISYYEEDNNFYKDLFFSQLKKKMRDYLLIYDDIIKELYDASSDFDKILDMVKKERNYISDIINTNLFDELASRLRTIEFETLRTPKGHKDDPEIIKYKVIRDDFKNEVRKKLDELKFVSDNCYLNEKKKCFASLNTLFKIVKDFRLSLLEEKKLENKFSFGDIAHFVIELLVQDGKKTKLASEISKRYKEILIDEYQDTNNLQNIIFNAISLNNENLFIVGDVKQSIYRFRSACPEIFNHDKNEASKDSFPKLIALSKNFRSRKEVLDFCNFIFENTMTENFGEVNYNEDERLYLGANFEEGSNLESEVHIIDGKNKSEDEEDDLTKAQKEAIYVADRIKMLLDNEENIYDNKLCKWRKIKPSDIVILLRSLKNSSLYIEALNKRNVSVYSESTSEYFDNYEIKLIINFLKIIDNPYDDVALMSILSSNLLDISFDDITDLRAINKNISLYENIVKSSNEEIKKLVMFINDSKLFSLNNSIYKVVNKIYKEFNVIPIIRGLKSGSQRGKNLIRMLHHAINFEKDEFKSLYEFISYIEKIMLNKGSFDGVNPLSEGDNVLITTIHKSKGLEYPVVFVCETGKVFNTTDLKNDLMINDDLGIAFNLKDPKFKVKYEAIPIRIFKEYEKSKMLSEELRILYVALTRAKEKIIITGYSNNLENLVTKVASKIGDNKHISNLYLNNVNCYLDIIIACLLRYKGASSLHDLSSVNVKTFASEAKIKTFIKEAYLINENEFKEKEVVKKEDFDFSLLDKKVKEEVCASYPLLLSVSDLKHTFSIPSKPSFMDDSISYTNLGTLYHKIFEKLPVKRYDVKSLDEALNNLLNQNIISIKEINFIDKNKVLAYLTSSLYELLLSSDNISREKKITFKVPGDYYDKNIKSGSILVDGVIDLLFKVDDTYYIVDYKTDDVNDLNELKDRYKVQLDLYEIGIKNIMKVDKVVKIIYSIKLNKYIKV